MRFTSGIKAKNIRLPAIDRSMFETQIEEVTAIKNLRYKILKYL